MQLPLQTGISRSSAIRFGQNSSSDKLNPEMPALKELREQMADGSIKPGQKYQLEDYKVPNIPMTVYQNNVVGFELEFNSPLEFKPIQEEVRVNINTGEIIKYSRAVGKIGSKETLEEAISQP